MPNKIKILILTIVLLLFAVVDLFILNGITTCLQAYIILFFLSILFCVLFIFKKELCELKVFIRFSKIKNTLNFNSDKKTKRNCLIASIFMTVIALVANYEAYTSSSQLFIINVLIFICLGAGFCISFCSIINFMICYSSSNTDQKINTKSTNLNKWFFVSWAIIASVYLLHLFLIELPGIINSDAFYQIDENISGNYDALYSFVHTKIIWLFLIVGNFISEDYPVGITLFCFVQILIISATFAYVIRTLKEFNISRIFLIVVLIWFAFLPCNIFLSATMLTDMFFTASMIVFIITLYRLLNKFTKMSVWNSILIVLSTLGIGLFRSNGIYILMFIIIAFAIVFRHKIFKKIDLFKMLFIQIIACTIACFVFLGPISVLLGVKSIDLVNKVSLPGQQIARVVMECDDLEDQQLDMINQVLNLDELREWYRKDYFDPLKFHIREHGNQQYIKDNYSAFVNLYILLGFKHPDKYIAAFIDSTSDYWAPHKNSILYDDPNFAFVATSYEHYVLSPELGECLHNYMQFFDDYLESFQSIGLYVWIFIISFAVALMGKDKNKYFVYVPVLINILIIIFAAPITNEIRYVYSVFCLMPFFLTVAVKSK